MQTLISGRRMSQWCRHSALSLGWAEGGHELGEEDDGALFPRLELDSEFEGEGARGFKFYLILAAVAIAIAATIAHLTGRAFWLR